MNFLKFINRGRPQTPPSASNANTSILDEYATTAPSAQNAVDIFRGEWASRLPDDSLEAGMAQLFEDERIRWAEREVGGFGDKSVLDLGPLEGGHPYMFERGGAAEIVAVEANTRAYLKCLITKELFGLQRVSYLCGNFVEYLKSCDRSFDLCNASGVLYHMRNPAEFIALISRVTGCVIVWTHYYDEEIITTTPAFSRKFPSSSESDYEGFCHTLYKHEYAEALAGKGFCGGTAPHANWMTRADILRCLEFFGLNDVSVAFEDRMHVNGPSFALVAKRTT